MSIKTVKINYVKGSIFETELHGLDAIIIYIPCGLTAIRIDSYNFIKQFGEPINQDGEFFLYQNKLKGKRHQGLDYVLIDRNKSNKIYNITHMRLLVDYTLNKMSKLGVKNIGMNGIRIRGGNPELLLVKEVKSWLVNNENNFKEIYFIDLRDGFNKNANENL
jgi:hypothetical protein